MSSESDKGPNDMWVEIIEPKSRERMFANLNTGECVWDEPEGVQIKRTTASQWWELFDTNTNRFYYYNVASQKTVWHRPENCDIIPLAKLQTIKQSTTSVVERRGKSDNKTKDDIMSKRNSNSRDSRVSLGASSLQDKRNSDHLASPQGRHTLQYSSFRLPPVSAPDDFSTSGTNKSDGSKYSKQHPLSTTGSAGRNNKYFDSGKSSDSSLSSSAHGGRKMQESGGSLRINSANQSKNRPSENFRLLQSSSSSHNIPHISIPQAQVVSTPTEKHHSPTSHMMQQHPSLSKKRNNANYDSKSRDGGMVSKHKSFDMLEDAQDAHSRSLTRSDSFGGDRAVAPKTHSGSRKQKPSSLQRRGSFGSDDSMHEKYFKSVENTPVSRRRAAQNSRNKHSSDSSPHSPISPPAAQGKSAIRPSQLVIEAPHNFSNKQSSQRVSEKEFYQQQRQDPKKKSSERLDSSLGKSSGERHRKSPGALSAHNKQQQLLQAMPPMNNAKNNGKQSSQQAEQNRNSLQKGSTAANNPTNKYLSKQNVDRHNKVLTQSTLERVSGTTGGNNTGHRSKTSTMLHSDVEYDNGNISPLYSNWDQEMQDHLLPLQHYILEQAKLSGCYGSGDNLDSDSYHSDSHSEHSLSGHEPDNEDSDHSDGRGDYLSHYPYDEYGAYGPSYYNFVSNIDKRNDKKDQHSEEVDAKLDSMQGQLYSPVKNHPANQLPNNKPFAPPQIQRPIPQYPSQRSQNAAQQQSKEEPYSTQSLYKNYPFDGNSFTRPIHSNSGQIATGTSRSQPKDKNFMHPAQLQQQQAAAMQQPPLPQQAKATLLQKFQENMTFHSPEKIAEMALMKECDIEKFAQDNLNLHSKGIFRKKSSVRDMLSWTPDAISRPMLSLPIAREKAGKKMAIELFKLVQIYMGDRKARPGMTLNSVASDIITMTLAQAQLRDELYVQLCRQTTENPSRDSLIRGWELLAICLSFIPPSPTFQPALLGYMNRHRDQQFSAAFQEINKWPTHVQISHYATIACRRLDRIGSAGKKQAKKPSEDEINTAREQIFRDSMFGNTIKEVMELQKQRFPERKLPWIQVTLSKQVLKLNGFQTEGIFRVPADAEEVAVYKQMLDRWEWPEDTGTMDAHTPASLLKLWYRELYNPLISENLYEECVQTEDPKEAMKIVEKLPKSHKLVLTYLIHFLQQFAQPEVVANTKMDSSNLAMVFAPNILRCISDDPRVILENARKEMAFLRTLILHMDTSAVANMI
ncbi:rho GTPase-activating protein 39 [Culicoides brevitarsis]|uniref:rho GTPase-activating protein 39 n=1 Tax=Culicoides brevitarsis TaxID=469753 RepID=UPI00307C1C29